MKSLLLLPALLCLLPPSASWRFVSKVEELPVEVTNRLEISRPKVRLCGGDSEESTDCVLCTVCHPHEYELIGCSGQMDSVCASCTTGWMRSTPKTVDFFRKCKKHPQLPFLFPDVHYPMRLESAPSSMFADQEKMLQDAENTETAEMDDEASEETDDYDGEEEEVSGEQEEEEASQETGVKPVDVDERDDDDSEWTSYEKAERESSMEKDSEEQVDDATASEDVNESFEDEDSAELKEEERADPFDTNQAESEEDSALAEDDSEESGHRLYPLHKANIWRIIGPDLTSYDNRDISKEVRQAISERKKMWQLEKEVLRIRQAQKNIRVESIEIVEDYNDIRQNVQGGYRPLPVRTFYVYSTDSLIQTNPMLVFGWILCFSLLAVSAVLAFRIYVARRRQRVMVLPELDDMSRMLINEAHARVHGKKEKMPKPEFV